MIINGVIIVLILVALFVVTYISVKNKNKENFIIETDAEPIYGQYFNPYFIRPTTCMETLFGTLECYELPKNIWTNDWWYNR